MSVFHRALLYVTRKLSKSLLLFFILLVIATLTLSGVAIRKATDTAQLNVRQALGGVFTLAQNRDDPDKWVSSSVGSFGSSSYYGGAPLTTELADYIRDNVSGISGSNATYTNYVVPLGKDGEILELLESADDGSGMNSLLSSYGDFNSTVAAYASTDTAYDSYFTGGYIELTDGRHFTDADGNVAIISNELAQKNNLKIGDTITLRMSEFKAGAMGYDAAKTRVEVKIVGLFKASVKSSTSLSNWSMDNSIYTTLSVVRAARPDMGDESYEKIQFYANDPGELDNIVKQVEALPQLDPTDFVVSVDSSNADAVMEPLSNMSRLVTILIILVVAVGAVILYLVLASRIKERVHESGVLLSLGLSKLNIAAQYLTEILLIAVLSFALSVFTSEFLAQSVGNQLLDYSVSESVSAGSAESSGYSKDGMIVSDSDSYAPDFEGANNLTEIEVSVSPAVTALVFGIGFVIIFTAVMMAALPVLKMKPREILSKMS